MICAASSVVYSKCRSVNWSISFLNSRASTECRSENGCEKKFAAQGNARNSSGRIFFVPPAKVPISQTRPSWQCIARPASCRTLQLNAVKAKYWNHQESYWVQCIWLYMTYCPDTAHRGQLKVIIDPKSDHFPPKNDHTPSTIYHFSNNNFLPQIMMIYALFYL